MIAPNRKRRGEAIVNNVLSQPPPAGKWPPLVGPDGIRRALVRLVEAVEDDLGEVRYMLEDRAFGVELCHYADVFAIAGDLAMVGRREERLREKLKTMADREGRD
jgi:hypothetical protein